VALLGAAEALILDYQVVAVVEQEAQEIQG
jgi:hypothetical protein